MTDRKSDIIISGGGVAGVHAALTLAECGLDVLIVESGPAIGGMLLRLDHQFPNNGCGICRLLHFADRDDCEQTCLRKGLFHQHIRILTGAHIVSATGPAGRLQVTISVANRGIDPVRCTGCGACETACPIEIPDSFNAGLGTRKAIYLPTPQAAPQDRLIDWSACNRCGACVNACPTDAIRLDVEPETLREEHAAMLLLIPGLKLFDPSVTDLYRYGQSPQVLTSVAFERWISSAGPGHGNPLRPGDGKAIQNIAWVQCVGSRHLSMGADTCSSACCMISLKQAMLARQKFGPEIELTIFYMDLRTYHKTYQQYRDQAERDCGVQLIRSRVHSIESGAGADDLRLSYITPDGQRQEGSFDIAVLACGNQIAPPYPHLTPSEGILLLESSAGIPDIAETIIHSGAMASRLLRVMAKSGALKSDYSESIKRGPDAFRSALIIGGGPAGLAAALAIAETGIPASIVEQAPHLGGNYVHFHEPELKQRMAQLLQAAQNQALIHIYAAASVIAHRGVSGRFETRLRQSTGEEVVIRHGAVILATGGAPITADYPGHILHERVVTQFELETRLARPEFWETQPSQVVMLQCVAMREPPRNYCSRICCLKSLKLALIIKDKSPDTEVVIFFRDMMTYGQSERVYQQARRQGVVFIPYGADHPPRLSLDQGRPMVAGFDPAVREEIQLTPDWIALATGIAPQRTEDVAGLFGAETDAWGFFREVDPKWLPLDSARPGVFMAGAARAPMRFEEALLDGEAAAARVLQTLLKPRLKPARQSPQLRPALCSLCLSCITACPFQARTVNPELYRIELNPAACQGCGICAAVCPNGAAFMPDQEWAGVE